MTHMTPGEPNASLAEHHTVDGRIPFRATLKPWRKPLFVGIYRGNIRNLGVVGVRPSTVWPLRG